MQIAVRVTTPKVPSWSTRFLTLSVRKLRDVIATQFQVWVLMSDEFCFFFVSFIMIVYYISFNMLFYIQIINKSLHLDTIYIYIYMLHIFIRYLPILLWKCFCSRNSWPEDEASALTHNQVCKASSFAIPLVAALVLEWAHSWSPKCVRNIQIAAHS